MAIEMIGKQIAAMRKEKGIKQEDIDKIPNKLIEFLQENSCCKYSG